MTSCTTLRGRRWARSALLVVIVAVSACSGGNSDGHAPSTPLALGLPDLTGATVDVTTPLTQDRPRDGSPAPSPREAVLRFARAETAADTDSSFDLLSEADRAAVRTRIIWKRLHASLPTLVEFVPNVQQAAPTKTTATLAGTARFTPVLDEINGLVAARANIVYTAVAEDGGWRVAYRRSASEPLYPNEASATEAARAWLEAAQACTAPAPNLEYAGGIVGSVGIAATLCRGITPKIESPKRLGDRPDPAAVLAAFGPEADTWARVVRVSGPRTFHLVLAPFDDRWIVIGVLADGP